MIIAIVMLFWSFGVNVFSYAMPTEARDYVTSFSTLNHDLNMNDVAVDIEESLTEQTNIPIIDVGALVFYSGNIMIDLFMNFAFAIPEMIGVVTYGITALFSIDAYIVALVELLAAAIMGVIYIMSIITFVTGMYSGRLEG